MTDYTQLLSELKRGVAGRIEAEIPGDWMQGRTTYGGLTAALSLESAKGLVDDLPIRSAQVAFVGPVGGPVVISPTLLRRGKSSAFVSVDIVTEEGVAARSIFTFGKARESSLSFRDLPMPDVQRPDDAPSFFQPDRRPNFTQHFNVRLVKGSRPVSGSDGKTIGVWMRNRDEATPQDASAILAIADCPPPAVLSMFKQPAPISSMTWMAEFLTDNISTTDGWWYAQSTAQTALDGYSSQSMRLWNSDGEPTMVGRQTVAVFG